MKTTPVFEIDGKRFFAKGARKHYLNMARIIATREKMPQRIQDLKTAKDHIVSTQKALSGLSLGDGVFTRVDDNNERSLEQLSSAIANAYNQKERLNDLYDEQIQAMSEAGVPWMNRFVEVRLREGRLGLQKNPYIDYSQAEDGLTGEIKFDELAAELYVDLGRYLNAADFKIVRADEPETFDVDPIHRTEVTGARVLFSEAIEQSMPLILANITKDRIMSHPDIGGTGKESWEALRKIGDSLDGPDAIAMLEYEFRTNHPENTFDYIGAGLLFGVDLDCAVKGMQFHHARVHPIPAVVGRYKDVMIAKAKHDDLPSLETEKDLEVAMLSAFVDHVEKKLQPEQYVDLPM